MDSFRCQCGHIVDVFENKLRSDNPTMPKAKCPACGRVHVFGAPRETAAEEKSESN